jgi:hypothetical protein
MSLEGSKAEADAALPEVRLGIDFVAEIGIPTARDGWCIF